MIVYDLLNAIDFREIYRLKIVWEEDSTYREMSRSREEWVWWGVMVVSFANRFFTN
jgi:hypothetical protein